MNEQLQDIEIKKFEETPDQKMLGICHVLLFNKILLKYKVVEKKDGSGIFAVAPSYKREFSDGTEKWAQWFMLDSQWFSEQLQENICDYVNNYIRSRQQQPQQQPNYQNAQYSQPSQTEGQLPF